MLSENQISNLDLDLLDVQIIDLEIGFQNLLIYKIKMPGITAGSENENDTSREEWLTR